MGINTEFCSDVNESQEFKCQCKDGFAGKRCEVAVCSSNYCNNNGLCTIKSENEIDIDQLQCECNVGFDGQRCEIDLCDKVSCENGSCDGGKCTCDEGYIRKENICKQTCDLNPCEVFTLAIYWAYRNPSLISFKTDHNTLLNELCGDYLTVCCSRTTMNWKHLTVWKIVQLVRKV